MHNALLYILTVLIWGSTWYAVTLQLGVVHPVVSVTYRFALAAILLFIYTYGLKKNRQYNFTIKQHGFIALLGLCLFCLNYILFYFGTQYLTSGLVAILFSTITLMNIFNQALFFKIKVKKQVAFGSFIGLFGIVFVFWPEISNLNLGDNIVKGMLICVLASYSASLGNMVSIKNGKNNIPVLEANTFGMAYGALFSFILAALIGAPFTFDTSLPYVSSMLYLACFGSAIAFGCYLTLMKNIGADKAAYSTVLFPIVALTISTFLEGYVWTPLSLFGVMLALIGNVIAMIDPKQLINKVTPRTK
ncbi:MAG: DMT family transporter [Alphaproteobacteria bacterium]